MSSMTPLPLKYTLALLSGLVHLSTASFADTLPNPEAPSSKKHIAPAPLMSVLLKMGEDSKKWKIGHGSTTPFGVLVEMIPEGESVSEWNEMSTSIILLGMPKKIYLKNWKEGLLKAGAKIIKEENLPDGSFLMTYSSSEENGTWRYIEGLDGLYGVSYQTRPTTEAPLRLKIWEKILRDATLQSNPTASVQK